MRRRRFDAARRSSSAAAVAAVAAIGLGIWALGLSSDLDDARGSATRGRGAAPCSPTRSAQRATLDRRRGRLVVADDRSRRARAPAARAPPGRQDVRDLGDRGRRHPRPAGLFERRRPSPTSSASTERARRRDRRGHGRAATGGARRPDQRRRSSPPRLSYDDRVATTGVEQLRADSRPYTRSDERAQARTPQAVRIRRLPPRPGGTSCAPPSRAATRSR